VSAPSRPPGSGDTFTPTTPVEPGKPKPTRPRELDFSVWCWLAAIAIGLAAGIVETVLLPFSTLADVGHQMAQAGEPIDMSRARDLFPAIKGVAVAVTVVTHGIWLLFALKCRSGRHWARTLLAVLGVVWLVYTLASVPQLPVGQLLAALAQTLAVISAGYYMFRPACNKYFAALRTPPPGRPPSNRPPW
jgi:hypothetical protein